MQHARVGFLCNSRRVSAPLCPILNFIGTDDDFTSPQLCRKNTEILYQQGSKAELVVYEGAFESMFL